MLALGALGVQERKDCRHTKLVPDMYPVHIKQVPSTSAHAPLQTISTGQAVAVDITGQLEITMYW